MKRALVAFTLTSCFFAQATWAAASPTIQLKDKKDKVSYSIGVDVGRGVEKQKIDINPDAFFAGFKDGRANKSSLMTDDEIQQTLVSLQTEIMDRQKAQLKALADKNLNAGEKFLAENKKQKGVVALPSGLQYRVITEGKGDSPKGTDTVTTHYRGKLLDGTEFDSSYSRGEPVKFEINGVIPGWSEALKLMKPGAKWELFIPPKLAYGEQSIGQIIGPNSTLIFEVELLSVNKAENKAANNVNQNKAKK